MKKNLLILSFLFILINIQNGISSSLKLTKPNGGEVFLVGSDTLITWEGVSPLNTVILEYSIDNGTNWKLISDIATGLSYNWSKVPNQISNNCLMRISLKDTLLNAPNIEWEKTYGGTKTDIAYSIVESKDNSYFVAGTTYSNDGDVTVLKGFSDFFVIKISDSGKLIWQKTCGGIIDTYSFGSDIAYSVKQTTDGGAVASGIVGASGGDVIENKGVLDFWVVKYDLQGNIEWTKSFGGSSMEINSSIENTIDGGFVVVGRTISGNGDVNDRFINSDDAWVVKLNSKGKIEWNKTFGGINTDEFKSIIQERDGSYVIAGHTCSNDGDIKALKGICDIWVIKIDSIGNIIWQKLIGGNNLDIAKSIKKTLDGGYIVAGQSSGISVDIPINKGNADITLIKLDSLGNLQWLKTFGGSDVEEIGSVDITKDGGFIICGSTKSNDFDINENKGKYDFLVIKVDKNGNKQWLKTYGGWENDFAKEIHQTKDLGYVIAGSTNSTNEDISQNKGRGFDNTSDFWVVKLLPESKFVLQDTSDALFSIIAPAPNSQDVDLKKCLLTKYKDSTIIDLIQNNSAFTIRIDSVYISGIDKSAFEVINLIYPFDLISNTKKAIEFRFIPNRIGLHSAKINIQTQTGLYTQNIIGEGYKLIDTANITLKTLNLQANTGYRIKIPIILESAINLSSSSITSISTVLSFNSTMLYPSDYKTQYLANRIGTITIDNIPTINKKAGDTLALIKCVVTLGNAENCDLVLSNPKVFGGEAKVNLLNGSFKLLDVCYDGGERLMNGKKQTNLFSITPIPSNESIDINYSNADNGIAEFRLIDVLGQTVSVINLEKVQDGKAKMNLNNLPSGQYIGVFSTESYNQNMIISVIK